MECLTHVQEELRLRNIPYATPRYPAPKTAILEYMEKHTFPKIDFTPDQIFRFSKREYLETLLHEGTMRIAPASYYAKKDLVGAQQDNELALRVIAQPGDIRFNVFVKDTGETITRLNPNVMEIEFNAEHDFYLLCMAKTYAPRLWFDFEGSDACLIVTDRDAFLKRVESASEQQMPGWKFTARNVRYIDAYVGTTDGPPPVDVSKSILYAYQQEFRLLWNPEDPSSAVNLQPQFLQVGPLTDCCKLVYLDENSTVYE